ncbi:hypothetical protein BKA93DRAFT_816023 [Sparassis latifolia]
MTPSSAAHLWGPYPNESSYRLGRWYWNGSTMKSKGDFKDLVGVLSHPRFIVSDVVDTKWDAVDQKLGDSHPSGMFDARDGWRESSVTISIPSGQKGVPAADFEVPGVFYCPIEQVTQEEVYGELYSSSVFRQAHLDLQSSPPEPGCKLPHAIAAMMLCNASLWPIYLLFGNQSNSRACHHVVYIPKLPDNIQDFICKQFGKEGSKPLITHCQCELMHAIWKLLLGDQFEEACRHGIVMMCGDGIRRHLYLHLFTYSADYPEKVLLATVHDMGACPCPRCLVPKAKIDQLGTAADMHRRETQRWVDDPEWRRKVMQARKFVYDLGFAVNSTAVGNLLQSESWVPTENAFASRLAKFLTNLFIIFLPDVMHEWELGVWKAIVLHLVRILIAAKGGKVQEFDALFRQVPIFGCDTIRQFDTNISEFKKLTAHNYEDILQCIIPVFDGLLSSPHDEIIQDVLFTVAYLHGLHKLRMHTERTVKITEAVTSDFGKILRRFQAVTCQNFETTELPKESTARVRQAARKMKSGTLVPTGGNAQGPSADSLKSRRRKEFNMNMYKAHSLGDYPWYIRGEMEHRRAKRRFERTSKKDFIAQLTSIERHEARIHAIGEHAANEAGEHTESSCLVHEPEEPARSHLHHAIAVSQKNSFLRKLKDHVLHSFHPRNLGEGPQTWTDTDRDSVVIKDDRMYAHQTLTINYTTYDVRRAQDTINPSTARHDVMVLADNDDPHAHPFWYARVLGIYHINAVDLSPNTHSDGIPKHVEFLLVRWLGEDPDWCGGWHARRLDRIGFIPASDNGAFGILDPADILRACHLIPVFALGCTNTLLQHSRLAWWEKETDDWDRFYVNRFVDRDMIMRYMGCGIGHKQGFSGTMETVLPLPTLDIAHESQEGEVIDKPPPPVSPIIPAFPEPPVAEDETILMIEPRDDDDTSESSLQSEEESDGDTSQLDDSDGYADL